MTTAAAVTAMETIAGLGLAVTALETLAARGDYAPGGLYHWSVLRTARSSTLSGVVARPSATLFRYPNFLFLPVVQVLLACSLILRLSPPGAPRGLLIVAVLATILLAQYRNPFGLDGSDQMQVIVLAGLAVHHLAAAPLLREMALLFVALQLVLSYVTSGVAKLTSATWRDGSALPGILATSSYGSRRMAALLERHGGLALMLAWATMLFEALGPLSLLLGPQATLVFLAGGATLHVAIAAFMGLNNFLFAFLATYPAVWLLAERLHGLL